MMTAEEARKISDVANARELRLELRGVETRIEREADCNQHKYSCIEPIHSETIKVLTDSGYKVSQDKSDPKRTRTYIEW